mmetsp:Transcript_25313/g.70789  ORF Transcript_25313/g.70789 Transcript_25313/m.70789 type:complete len:205 (-) Transcript_25313:199-813(-)|eukprot:CAMPEP_0117673522 /NCGR_PEP_ID=MMETSP0804-20121206/14520_1 /TAXON_ID=1074897 /ORGANISM="Tetraselmis astigmatica, Strain CCMP880" /LENGTH=204 /DNA_ID=CAMNT_0005482271 /DNA_START=46 /DNA_END=660 /DNA_ORIENTATION=+
MTTCVMALCAAQPALLPARAVARVVRSRPPIFARVVRASAAEQNTETITGAEPSTSGTVFYGGSTYTDAEWEEALRKGATTASTKRVTVDGSVAGETSFGDVMAFSGPAPEIINGRLAMLGFVSAIAAELRTEETILQQWGKEPTLIALTFILLMAGSLAPMFSGKKDSLGPFTPEAEMLNGRAAMIGFASILIAEAVRGSALF